MRCRYAEVALPVPLRSVFTYAVPASLDGQPLVGRRVVVPFGRRTMIGVALSETDHVAESVHLPSPLKEIAELVDPLPALPPKLVELGHWISRYYLAPVGEAFRAMLPPEIELRRERRYSLTDSGRAYLQELSSSAEITDVEAAELTLLRGLAGADSSLRPVRARGNASEASADVLVRRGYLSVRDMLSHRKTRTQKIVAWNAASSNSPANV